LGCFRKISDFAMDTNKPKNSIYKILYKKMSSIFNNLFIKVNRY